MKQIAVALSLLITLTGCKVGPNYTPPITQMPYAFSEDQPDKTTPIYDEDLVQWWTIFNDPFLNQLLEETRCGNFDYRIALEQVYQARAQYWVQLTQIFPEIDGDAQASHFRSSQSFASATVPNAANSPHAAASSKQAISPVRNFFQVGFDAIWEIDLFGKLRRSAQAAYETWEASLEDARGVKITVLSEVANTYAIICATQKKVQLAKQLVQLDENVMELSQILFEAGLGSEQEVEAAYATLEGNKANLFQVETTLKLNIYSFAVLLGRMPETLMEDFQVERAIPYAGGKVPAGIPGELLRRRPDILSAERKLAAATEQIGVAVADLFPKVSLIGSTSSFAANPLQGANIGFSSDTASKLFNPSSFIWGVGALVTFPVFDFGKRQAAINIQVALKEQAYYSYQKTVIAALEEVEKALFSYFNEEAREDHLTKAAQASKRSLDLATDLYQSGLANYTQVLQSENTWIVSMNALIDSQQLLTTDLIAIYKAMGGDW